MKRSQRLATLILLDREMLQRGSWCGETHIQKATFLLQELLSVKLGLDFVLYRHGPFSFDLRDEISLMQADDLLSLQVRHPGYGPSLVPTQFSETFLSRFPNTTARYRLQIEFIAEELGRMNVAELERISTAFYITQHGAGESIDENVAELVDLKPHISAEDAYQAFTGIYGLIDRASSRRLISESGILSE